MVNEDNWNLGDSEQNVPELKNISELDAERLATFVAAITKDVKKCYNLILKDLDAPYGVKTHSRAKEIVKKRFGKI